MSLLHGLSGFVLFTSGLAQAAMPLPADSRGVPALAPMLAQEMPAVVNISVMARPF